MTALSYRMLVFENPAYAWVAGPWLCAVAFSVGVTLAGLVFGLYERQTLGARSRIWVRSGISLATGLSLAWAFISLCFYTSASRWLGLIVGVSYLATMVPLRLLAHDIMSTGRLRVLCIGAESCVQQVEALLSSRHHPHHEVVGFVDVPVAAPLLGEWGLNSQVSSPRLGAVTEIERVLDQHGIDQVVVDGRLSSDPAVGDAVIRCLDRRCRVTDQPTFVEKVLGEVPSDSISAQWFLVADVQNSSGYEAVKRFMDIGAAVIGLSLTIVFWPLIALAIRLDSKGAILFQQDRVGLHGRVFKIYKFRTMRCDAEKDGARWADKNDSRVTRVGRFLRKSRLDELPQLWNILRGDMSLVGPRPERPEFVERLSLELPHYRQRHLIKPGLTGWAQIQFGYGASVADARRKLCYDLYYLKHRSIDLDASIVIRTIGTFLVGSR